MLFKRFNPRELSSHGFRDVPPRSARRMHVSTRRVCVRAAYCAPESLEAQNARAYRNPMSHNKLARTRTSAAVAKLNGSTKTSMPSQLQINNSLHFPKSTVPGVNYVELIAFLPLTRPKSGSSGRISHKKLGSPASFATCCHLSRTVGSTA